MDKRETMKKELKKFNREEYEKKMLESLKKANQCSRPKFPKKDKSEGR